MMERLTEHSKQTSHENGICCTHFRGPECLEVGGNCAMNCKWEEAAWSRLAAYEDKELEPEEVLPKDKADEIALKLMRLADLESLCSYTHLRELAEADKNGRVVILPRWKNEEERLERQRLMRIMADGAIDRLMKKSAQRRERSGHRRAARGKHRPPPGACQGGRGRQALPPAAGARAVDALPGVF